MKLRIDRTNHYSDAANKLRRHFPKLKPMHVVWIVDRFFHYAFLALIHGYEVFIHREASLSMYQTSIHDVSKKDIDTQFVRSEVIHGLLFTIKNNRGWAYNDYKARFVPSSRLRKKMNEYLRDPDLVYNLIQ
jgi:hypothetical protein